MFGASTATLLSFGMFWVWCWMRPYNTFDDLPVPLQSLWMEVFFSSSGSQLNQGLLQQVTLAFVILAMIGIHLAAFGLYWSCVRIRRAWNRPQGWNRAAPNAHF